MQEESMGCAVACVASLLSLTYASARKIFPSPKRAHNIGFYCRDIITAIKRKGKHYSFKKYAGEQIKPGTIAFIARSKKYPTGEN